MKVVSSPATLSHWVERSESVRVSPHGFGTISPSSGSWEQMDDLDLSELFLMRMPMLRSCLIFHDWRLRQSFGAALEERHRAEVAGDELTGAVLVRRTRAILDEFHQRRPLEQRREIPQPVLDFNPDEELFVSALRSSPCGSVQEDARTKCSVSVWMTHMCFSFIQLPRIQPGERDQLRDFSSSRR